jgi:hypothetical protein
MHDSACLAGHVILIVEAEMGLIAPSLQVALELAGAETLIAHDAVRARDLASQFECAAAVVNCDGGTIAGAEEMHELLNGLGGMPVLLYGATPPCGVLSGNAQFLAASKPVHVDTIVKGVARLVAP